MQGAVIPSILRKSRQGRRRVTAAEVDKLLNKRVVSLFQDMDEVDSLIKDTEYNKVFGSASDVGQSLPERFSWKGCWRRWERAWAGRVRT
eukprot:763848-Hanusia_phi.AAC.2